MKNIHKKFYILTFLILTSVFSYGQVEPGGEGGTLEDAETAPIDDYLPFALVACIGFGFVLLRKKISKQS